MPSHGDFKNYVARKMRETRKTKVAIGKTIGSRQNLNNVLNDYQRPSIDFLVKLAYALEVSTVDLLRRFYSDHGLHNVAYKDNDPVPIHTDTQPKYPGDYSSFVSDATIPDGTIVYINQEFDKIWKIQNTGDVVWTERKLVCFSQTDNDIVVTNRTTQQSIPLCTLIPTEKEIPIPTTRPHETVELKVRFKAPAYPCKTISYWKMVDKNGDLCFPKMTGLFCQVIVVAL